MIGNNITTFLWHPTVNFAQLCKWHERSLLLTDQCALGIRADTNAIIGVSRQYYGDNLISRVPLQNPRTGAQM